MKLFVSNLLLFIYHVLFHTMQKREPVEGAVLLSFFLMKESLRNTFSCFHNSAFHVFFALAALKKKIKKKKVYWIKRYILDRYKTCGKIAGILSWAIRIFLPQAVLLRYTSLGDEEHFAKEENLNFHILLKNITKEIVRRQWLLKSEILEIARLTISPLY